MKYLVVQPQIRNVTFQYTDLATGQFDIEAPPFDSHEEADEYNTREHDGNAVVLALADDYLENFPTPQTP